MLKVQAYASVFGEPSGSPFCVKAMCLLQLSGQDWEIKHTTDPRKAPKGKLPVLEHDGKVVADSDDIRDYLENTFDIDFDKGLSPQERAISRAVIRMMEEHVYFALSCDRWVNDENWVHVKQAYFSNMPPIIGGLITNAIRKQVINANKGQGLGRHSPTERFQRVKKDIDAVEIILADQPFLFGDFPTAADVSAVTMLSACAAAPVPTDISKYINQNSGLMAYIKRGRETFYPKAE
ncbi:MAG: glutathione S-transferase family protein [Hyphomicrobiales bacterium]